MAKTLKNLITKILATVPSRSNPEKTYNICEGHDGVVYCTCPGWMYQRKVAAERTCPHLKAFHAGQLGSATPVESKSVAGRDLSLAKTREAARKSAHAAHKAMTKGSNEEARAAAQMVLDGGVRGASQNLRDLAAATLR